MCSSGRQLIVKGTVLFKFVPVCFASLAKTVKSTMSN